MTESRSKYGNKRTMVDNIEFASKAEANRYVELKMLQLAGEIKDLQLQVKFRIVVSNVHICDYIADFCYTERLSEVVEDVKGVRTREYRLKAKLMKAIWGIEIREVKA